MVDHFVDLLNGNNANSGLDFPNRKKTPESVVPSGGDQIRVMGSEEPTDTGLTVTYTHNSATLTALSTNPTTGIYRTGTWTAIGGGTVTASTSSTRKVGTNSATLAIAAGFTTGLAGYFNTGSLDLSGRQLINIRLQSSIVIAANVMRLRLSTTTNSGTATHDFVLNRAMTATTWNTFVFDAGAAMNGAILSVGLVFDSDPGTPTITIDCIMASKAYSAPDCLTFNTLIGKSGAGQPHLLNKEMLYGIAEITGTTIQLDAFNGWTSGGTTNPYVSPTQSTTTLTPLYKCEPILLDQVAAAVSTCYLNANGTSGAPITVSGGWNTTDMSTQNGYTRVMCHDGLGAVFGLNAIGNWSIWNRLSAYRGGSVWAQTGLSSGVGIVQIYGSEIAMGTLGFDALTHGLILGSAAEPIHINRCINGPRINAANSVVFDSVYSTSTFNSHCFVVSATSGCILRDCVGTYSSFDGIAFSAAGEITVIRPIIRSVARSFTFQSTSDIKIYDAVEYAATTAAVGMVTNLNEGCVFYNPTFNSSTKHASIGSWSNMYFSVCGEGGDPRLNTTYFLDGNVSTSLAVVDTLTTSQKFTPTGGSTRNLYMPMVRRIAILKLQSGVAHTVTVRARKDNAAVVGWVRIPNGAALGITANIDSGVIGSVNTWVDLTLVVTADQDCYVELLGCAYEGTTYSVYFEKVTMT